MSHDPHVRLAAVLKHAFAFDDRWMWVLFGVWGFILAFYVWTDEAYAAYAVAGILVGVVLGRASTMPAELRTTEES